MCGGLVSGRMGGRVSACAAETVQNRAKTSKLQNRASTVSRVVNVLDTIHLPVQKRVVKARADLLCFARVA